MASVGWGVWIDKTFCQPLSDFKRLHKRVLRNGIAAAGTRLSNWCAAHIQWHREQLAIPPIDGPCVCLCVDHNNGNCADRKVGRLPKISKYSLVTKNVGSPFKRKLIIFLKFWLWILKYFVFLLFYIISFEIYIILNIVKKVIYIFRLGYLS